MLHILDPRLWMALIFAIAASAGVGYLKGGKVERAAVIAEQAKAAAQARDTEMEIQRHANRADSAYLTRIAKQQEKAHALPKITLAADCVVPADVGGVLNAAAELPADAGTGPGAGTAGQAVDSTCAAELDIAKRNYAEVCIPNAEQLKELQQRWIDTRERILRDRMSRQ